MESEGSSSSLAGCQPGALEVVGSNPTDPIFIMGSHTVMVGYNNTTVTCYRKKQAYRRSAKTQCQQS
jgi:hypothetical protein